MPADGPRILCRALKIILENPGVREIARRTDPDAIVEIGIGRGNRNTRHIGKVKNARSVIRGSEFIRSVGKCSFTDKTEALRPDGVWRDYGDIFQRKCLRACTQLLREISDLADGEWSESGIVLKVIFSRNAIPGIEVVIDVCVDLVRIDRCLGSNDKSVIAESSLRG